MPGPFLITGPPPFYTGAPYTSNNDTVFRGPYQFGGALYAWIDHENVLPRVGYSVIKSTDQGQTWTLFAFPNNYYDNPVGTNGMVANLVSCPSARLGNVLYLLWGRSIGLVFPAPDTRELAIARFDLQTETYLAQITGGPQFDPSEAVVGGNGDLWQRRRYQVVARPASNELICFWVSNTNGLSGDPNYWKITSYSIFDATTGIFGAPVLVASAADRNFFPWVAIRGNGLTHLFLGSDLQRVPGGPPIITTDLWHISLSDANVLGTLQQIDPGPNQSTACGMPIYKADEDLLGVPYTPGPGWPTLRFARSASAANPVWTIENVPWVPSGPWDVLDASTISIPHIAGATFNAGHYVFFGQWHHATNELSLFGYREDADLGLVLYFVSQDDATRARLWRMARVGGVWQNQTLIYTSTVIDAWFHSPISLPGAGPVQVVAAPPMTGTRRMVILVPNLFDHCLWAAIPHNRKIPALSGCCQANSLEMYLRNVEQPTGAIPFYRTAGIPTPLAAAGDTLILRYRLPLGFDGVLKALWHRYSGPGFLEGNGDIEWRLKINKVYAKHLGRLLVSMGQVGESYPLDDGIPLTSLQWVEYIVSVPNLSGGILPVNSTISAGVEGWMWPRR